MIKEFRSIRRITSVDEVARRYFVMNAFDGSLTMLGIIVGGHAAGSVESRVIVRAGLGATFAMGISGAWGTYMAEKAERTRSLKELEVAMHANLKDSMLYRASRIASLWASLVDGLSPAIAAMISLSPFLLSQLGLLPSQATVPAAVILNLVTLFGLGIFLGRVSRENVIAHGCLMVLAGLGTTVLALMLGISP
jgi:predicted membrane protein (TIGR00267 family)